MKTVPYFRNAIFRSAISASILCLFSWSQCPAQTPLSQLLSSTPVPTNNATSPTDPLNRTTPSGTVLGFLEAVQRGDNSIAAQYLQMSVAHRQTEGEHLAVKLKYVMDNSFAGSLKNVSTQPEGVLQEGVTPGHQKVGTMAAGDVEVDVELVRVTDPAAGKIWLFSADTLAKVPELYDQVQARQVEHKLPAVLVKHQLAGMPLWQWTGLLAAILVAIPVGWLV